MLILHRKISSVSKVESVRELILISESDSKTFDNSPLTCHDVIIDGDGLAEGDTISYSFTGSQKWIGSSENTFTYSINNVSGTNYIVTCEYGELAVTDDDVDDALIVEMTADGQEGSEDETQYRLGDTVTFEISVKNPYADIETITLSEIEGVTLAQSTFADVTSGDTVSTTATYTIMEDNIINGSFTNTVTASIENLTKTAECTILTEDVDATLTCNIRIANEPANGTAYQLGETIQYRIDVTNEGNVTYHNVQVTCEATDFSLTRESLSIGQTISSITTGHVVSEADIVRGSFTETVTVEGDELEDGTVPMGDDSVTTGDEDDPDGPNYPIEEPNPSFAISIGYINPPANGTSYAIEENVRYELNVTNDGNLTITNAKVADETSGDSYTDISFDTGQLIQFGYHSHTITSIDIADGYFIIAGFVTGTSPDENNPEYIKTFNIQIPITPQ